MFSKDGPLAEKSAQDCGCFRNEQRACWGFIMLCQSWSWMVWEEYLMVQHLFDKLWISSKTNCQDIDFCDGNVLWLSLKNKACSSATAHPQLLHVLNRIVAHFKLETQKKIKAEPKQVSNDLLDKFGYVAENPGEYLIYNQARHVARSHSLAITINHIYIDFFRSCLLFFSYTVLECFGCLAFRFSTYGSGISLQFLLTVFGVLLYPFITSSVSSAFSDGRFFTLMTWQNSYASLRAFDSIMISYLFRAMHCRCHIVSWCSMCTYWNRMLSAEEKHL